MNRNKLRPTLYIALAVVLAMTIVALIYFNVFHNGGTPMP